MVALNCLGWPTVCVYYYIYFALVMSSINSPSTPRGKPPKIDTIGFFFNENFIFLITCLRETAVIDDSLFFIFNCA